MPTRNQIQISLLHTNTVQYKDKYRSTRVTFLSLACSGPHGNRLEWVNCQIGSSDRQSTCMHRVLITSYHWDPGLWEQFSTKRKKSSKPFHNPNQSWTNRKTSPAKSKEVVNKDRKEQSSPFHKVVSSCPKENSVALDQNDHQVCPNFRPCVKTRWRRVSLGKASLFPSSTCVFVCVCTCICPCVKTRWGRVFHVQASCCPSLACFEPPGTQYLAVKPPNAFLWGQSSFQKTPTNQGKQAQAGIKIWLQLAR